MMLDRPRIMGILNVTPDSFSDGGTHPTEDLAVDHGLRMLAEGADILDVGGESTRPGSKRVSADEQIKRITNVIRRLRENIEQTKLAAAISVDTMLARVAEAAIDAGASIINDVSAGRGDALFGTDGAATPPATFDAAASNDEPMLKLAARRGAPIVLMHMQGTPETMQANPSYMDAVEEVIVFLLDRVNAAMRVGVKREQIVLDPGIGFGKSKAHNLALLAGLPKLVATGFPVLLGTSRKRFMGSIVAGPSGVPPEPTQLIGATCATTALGVAAGVQLFRVHDITPNRQAADVALAIGQLR